MERSRVMVRASGLRRRLAAAGAVVGLRPGILALGAPGAGAVSVYCNRRAGATRFTASDGGVFNSGLATFSFPRFDRRRVAEPAGSASSPR